MTGDHDPQQDHCVARVPIFAGLSTADQELVTGLARPVSLPTGAELLGPFTAEPRLLVVHSGRLIIYRVSADGNEQVLRVLEPGDFTGEEAVLTGRQSRENARAVEDTQLCAFAHRDLMSLLIDHPQVSVQMLASLARRQGEVEDRLAALTSRAVTARVADYLLSLPASFVDGRTQVELPLPKKDVASLLDTTPESLSRALNRLASTGAIVSAGTRITLTDSDALVRLADE